MVKLKLLTVCQPWKSVKTSTWLSRMQRARKEAESLAINLDNFRRRKKEEISVVVAEDSPKKNKTKTEEKLGKKNPNSRAFTRQVVRVATL